MKAKESIIRSGCIDRESRSRFISLILFYFVRWKWVKIDQWISYDTSLIHDFLMQVGGQRFSHSKDFENNLTYISILRTNKLKLFLELKPELHFQGVSYLLNKQNSKIPWTKRKITLYFQRVAAINVNQHFWWYYWTQNTVLCIMKGLEN